MISPLDKIRARFQLDDVVIFGTRPPRQGILIRFNRTTAVVLMELENEEYRVPFALLQHATTPLRPSSEERLLTVDRVAECLLETHRLTRWTFKLDHSTRRAGCCNYRDRTISISYELARTATDAEIREVLLHEIAHALAGRKHHHDAHWKKVAQEIGCSGARCHTLQFSAPRYHISCENHCWKHTAERKNSRLVCRKCGGKIMYRPYKAFLDKTPTPQSML